jgi:hypothetical protein
MEPSRWCGDVRSSCWISPSWMGLVFALVSLGIEAGRAALIYEAALSDAEVFDPGMGNR